MNGEGGEIKKVHDAREVIYVNGNGNGKWRDRIYGFVAVILVALGGWNLKTTVEIKVQQAEYLKDLANFKDETREHHKELNGDIDAHNTRLYRLESGQAQATSDRFTKFDALKMETNLKQWANGRFVPIN